MAVVFFRVFALDGILLRGFLLLRHLADCAAAARGDVERLNFPDVVKG